MGIKITSTDILKNKALMVKLNRKKFNRNKTDKLMSEEICKLKKVTEKGAVRVNKSLFPKSVTQATNDIYSKAGKYYYRVSLPWDDQGYRLLSIDIYTEFTKKFKEFANNYRKEVAIFVESIQANVALARETLGDAFDINDYKFIAPNGSVDQEMLMNMFQLDLEWDVVSSGDDLRAVLTEADREAIAAQIDEQAMKKFSRAQEHIVTTLRDHVYAIHERLCKSEHVFRDSLIGNLEELVDLIPKMNIAGDPAINEMAAEAKKHLTKWDPQTLRDDDQKRKEVSDSAKKILSNMDGII